MENFSKHGYVNKNFIASMKEEVSVTCCSKVQCIFAHSDFFMQVIIRVDVYILAVVCNMHVYKTVMVFIF